MFTRLVVPTDFSAASAEAWELACRLARHGASILALNVVAPLFPDVAYANLPAAMREQERDNERRLATFAVVPRGLDLSVECSVVVGKPAPAIAETARKRDADVIVIGVHPRHGLDHWLRGSVAEHVVHEAPCHVLVVKHPH